MFHYVTGSPNDNVYEIIGSDVVGKYRQDSSLLVMGTTGHTQFVEGRFL